jgi:16S rRNA (guanine(966)-N(2))-methyltransferase RsmD
MNITAGKYKGQKIVAPDDKITRPTLSKVRMSIFNTLQAMIDFEGKSFLDMYAGSGIMGLEALSRNFSKVISIEKNKKVYGVIKSNFQKYEKDNDLNLILGDSLKVCTKFTTNFDIIFIDPPYFSGIYESSLEIAKTISNGIIILEHVVDVDFSGFEILKQKKYGDKFVTFLIKKEKINQ